MTLEYDKRRVARHFSRAAAHYQRFNSLQSQVAESLLRQLTTAPCILDLGCGPGSNSQRIAQQCEHYVGLDISTQMLAQAKLNEVPGLYLQGDAEQLPLANNSIDTVFSSLAVQWCNSLPTLLSELQRVVKPGGQILISTILADSMQPLMDCLQQIDGVPRQNPQLTLEEWRLLLNQQSHFQTLSLRQQKFSVFSPDIAQVLQGIKGVGASYRANTNSKPFRRETLRKLAHLYQKHSTEDGLPLHYQIGLIELRMDDKKS
ncbi:methyltransferase domain-containing protein [Aliidiomarina minuta]|nr:methyltransferase domain-containing protein [Aliidiomarina minuta]